MNAIPAIVATTVSRHCNCNVEPTDPLLNFVLYVVTVPLIFLHSAGMWAHYPTSRRKKMITALIKPPDSHTADHSQKLPFAAARLSSLVMPLPLKTTPLRFPWQG